MSASELYGPWPVEGYEVWIDFEQGVRLAVSRDGVRLKNVPPALRAGEDMAWIRLALEAAQEHHRNLRTLLEHAMVEGIPISQEDQAMLALDPAGRGMFGRLLMELGGLIGRPLPDDWLLETVGGDLARLGPPVRVVHPARLPQADLERWNSWLNRQPFAQPFKQIRRELYRVRPEDRETRTFSGRFAGECVRWDQARALLEGRGWHRVTKTGAERHFRSARLTAHLEFRTPASRGFSREEVLLNRVYFLPMGVQSASRAQPGNWLEDVPAVVFSEGLRDVSLVAQVAGPKEQA